MAACLLAALKNETHETDPEHVRSYAGAMLLAELVHDVRQIRRLLTPKE